MFIGVYDRTWKFIGDEFLDEARDCAAREKFTFAIRHYANAIKAYLSGAIPFDLEQENPKPSELWEALALCQVSKEIQVPLSIPMLRAQDMELLCAVDTGLLLDAPMSYGVEVSTLLENLDNYELLEAADRFATVAQAACYCAEIYDQFVAELNPGELQPNEGNESEGQSEMESAPQADGSDDGDKVTSDEGDAGLLLPSVEDPADDEDNPVDSSGNTGVAGSESSDPSQTNSIFMAGDYMV